MELHETIEVLSNDVSYIITRVPGGWIYRMRTYTPYPSIPVFIPFDNEFQKSEDINKDPWN